MLDSIFFSVSCLQWESDDKSFSISIEYPNIPVHGISSDTSSFPHQCVYLLHSVERGWLCSDYLRTSHCGMHDLEGDGGEECDDGEEELVELRLVPPDPSQCEKLFIKTCLTVTFFYVQ